MTMIAELKVTPTGFSGRIKTLYLDHEISFVEIDKNDKENAPDYRIQLNTGDDGIKIGAGWKRTNDSDVVYVSVSIDDPAFAQPIRARLYRSRQNEETYLLFWNRRFPRYVQN